MFMSRENIHHYLIPAQQRKFIGITMGDNPETVSFLDALEKGFASLVTDDEGEAFLCDTPYVRNVYLAGGTSPEKSILLARNLPSCHGIIIPNSTFSLQCIQTFNKNINPKTLIETIQTFSCTHHHYCRNEQVTILSESHRPLIEQILDRIRWYGEPDIDSMIHSSLATGIIQDGRIISLAFAPCCTLRYAEVWVQLFDALSRRSIGTETLAKLIELLQNWGMTAVLNTTNTDPAFIRFAQKMGFQKVSQSTLIINDVHADMIVNLYLKDFEHACHFTPTVANRRITIKRALAPDRTRILDYITKSFPYGYENECAVALSQTPTRCFIAIKDQTIIGFACYDATAKNFFGPLAVSRQYRHGGIGKILTMSCLQAMREDGYAYAIIGWVDHAQEYYKKMVNAMVIPGSFPGVYSRLIDTTIL
jgi:GNAT superfamily N-acetyltransferase